jgi:hypothetical protein
MPSRRVGRSNEERREAAEKLQRERLAKPGPHRLSVDQLRRARALMEQRLSSDTDRRRAEDRIRDEYHDSRAKTVRRRKKRR